MHDSNGEQEELMRLLKDKQKEDAGTTATVGFIASAVILLFSSGGLAAFFSLRAVLFVFVGMFVASVVLGNVFFWSAQFFVRIFTNLSDRTIARLGFLYLAFAVAMCFLFTRFAFRFVM